MAVRRQQKAYIPTYIQINSTLFQALAFLFISSVLIESITHGFVSRWININIFLAVVMASGIVRILDIQKDPL